MREVPGIAVSLTRSLLRSGGASLRERISGLHTVVSSLASTLRDPRRDPSSDPVRRTRTLLRSDPARLEALEADVAREVDVIVASAMEDPVS
jgi:hypothetical protein